MAWGWPTRGFPKSGKQDPTKALECLESWEVVALAPSICQSSRRDPQYHCHDESAADRPKAALETPGRLAQLLGGQFVR